MSKIPVVIAKFLALPNVEGLDISDKFAYLIKSSSGDDYYLCKQLVEEALISERMGHQVYEAVTTNVTWKDIFNWYQDWSNC